MPTEVLARAMAAEEALESEGSVGSAATTVVVLVPAMGLAAEAAEWVVAAIGQAGLRVVDERARRVGPWLSQTRGCLRAQHGCWPCGASGERFLPYEARRV